MNLRHYIKEAEEKKVAIGHFNISDSTAFWAVWNAAYKLKLPIIIGVSEGERKFIGVKQVAAMVKSLREEYKDPNNPNEPYPIFLNADHTYSFEGVKEAVDAGFDAVIFDGAQITVEENTKITKQCVEYARSVNPDIIVEAELGNIGQSSKILDGIPEGVRLDAEFLTKPEVAAEFVKSTGIDLLAPAVGNIHGMLRGGHDPKIDTERIKLIRKSAGVPLVLHGGSGTGDEDFVEAIKSGISIVHINTEIRLAYRQSLKITLGENPDEIAPYKFLKPSLAAMEKVVRDRLRLFNNLV